MKSNVKFSIPKPCHEDWNRMSQEEKDVSVQSVQKQ